MTDTLDRTAKLNAAHEQLTAAVDALVSGDDWARMLETASRFHHYSAANVFLIMMQRPDATQVAGYRMWQQLNRFVRKGERGIRILAPCKYTYKTTDDDGTETKHVGIKGFTTVAVFDVSQTDGAEIPDVRPALLIGDGVTGLWESLAAQVVAAGYTLERGDCDGANGFTRHSDKVVRIRDDVSDAQACKTLAHELAHVILHPDTAEYYGCRGIAEVEAESAAYLVCHAAGLDTGEYTFPYVARWADGKGDVVRRTADRALMAARQILAEVQS